MTITASRVAQLTAATLAGGLLATGGYALASSNGGKTIHGCVNKSSHVLTVQKRCNRHQTGLSWNQRGPAGQAGPTGPIGPTGAAGATGSVGPAGPVSSDAFGSIAIAPTGASVVGQNLAATRTGTGTATVTVTGGRCANGTTPIPVVSSEEAGGVAAYPEIAVSQPTPSPDQFSVSLQRFISGSWTPVDGDSVNVTVYCPS